MSLDRVSFGGLGALRRDGEGTPFVLLHGIGSAPESFLPMAGALGRNAPVLAWDMPGYGGSADLAPEWPDAGDYAAALATLLDGAGIARCVLLGHSLGVVTAARFARLYPERVALFAALSPALGYGVARGGALPQGIQARLDDLERLGPEGMAALRAERLVFEPAKRPAVLGAVRGAMGRVRPPGYRRASLLLAGADVLADAAAIRVPSLVVSGAEDVVTPPANAERLAAALGIEAHLVPGAGHALPQEKPETVAALLREALS